MTKVILDETIIQKRQAWVLRHPCSHYKECGRPGYIAEIKDGPITLRTVLSIDLFTQPWAWHSQIGVIGPDGNPKPRMFWTTTERIAAVAYARRMLVNVGQGVNALETDDLSLGYARILTWRETQAVLACVGNVPTAQKVAIGEIGEYDTTDKKSQVGDGLFIPTQREVLHGRGN